MKYRWLIAIAVWLVLGLSGYLYASHPWVETFWMFASILIVAATVVNFLFDFARPGAKAKQDATTRGGYPRWFLRFAYDDHRNSTNSQKDANHNEKIGPSDTGK
jgi:hypothetical protein